MNDYYTHVGIQHVESATEKAVKLVIDGDPLWVPLSVISPMDRDLIQVGDTGLSLCIATWFCEKEGLT